jgi:hypothetical protein
MNFWFENMPSGNPAAETFSIFAAEALLASQSWRLIKTLALFARALIGSDRKNLLIPIPFKKAIQRPVHR